MPSVGYPWTVITIPVCCPVSRVSTTSEYRLQELRCITTRWEEPCADTCFGSAAPLETPFHTLDVFFLIVNVHVYIIPLSKRRRGSVAVARSP